MDGKEGRKQKEIKYGYMGGRKENVRKEGIGRKKDQMKGWKK